MNLEETLAAIEAITGTTPIVLPDYGNWNGDRHVGFVCKVEVGSNRRQIVCPAPTKLEAAQSALDHVRSRPQPISLEAATDAFCGMLVDRSLNLIAAE